MASEQLQRALNLPQPVFYGVGTMVGGWRWPRRVQKTESQGQLLDYFPALS